MIVPLLFLLNLVIYSIWPRTGSLFGGAEVALKGNNFAEDLFIQSNEIYFGDISCSLIEYASNIRRTSCVTGHYSNYSYDHMLEITDACSRTPFSFLDELLDENISDLDTVIITNGKQYTTSLGSKTYEYLNSATPKVINTCTTAHISILLKFDLYI